MSCAASGSYIKTIINEGVLGTLSDSSLPDAFWKQISCAHDGHVTAELKRNIQSEYERQAGANPSKDNIQAAMNAVLTAHVEKLRPVSNVILKS